MGHGKELIPLAERMRPTTLAEMVGQDHLLVEDGIITTSIKKKIPLSLLLWGPPGCGKTTLARLYAKAFGTVFFPLSAVHSGTGELRRIIAEIEAHPLTHRPAIVFIDEIHRFNKAQQDILLPYIERGLFTLIGATTENPSFAINNALLSRLRVLPLRPLEEQHLATLLQRYEARDGALPLDDDARHWLARQAQGDARFLYNVIENVLLAHDHEETLTAERLIKMIQKRSALFDHHGDWHFNIISALHKAVRGSDADAALYWFARMLEGGEDPLYLARRLVRMATEDVGLADPHALTLAMAAQRAYEKLGSPEGELALAEVVVYLALAPKSNSVYTAYGKARRHAAETGHIAPPKHILNAPTGLMKEEGYGQGYQYDHDYADAFSGQDYWPAGVPPQSYYRPVERGFERDLQKRMDYFAKLRNQRRGT